MRDGMPVVALVVAVIALVVALSGLVSRGTSTPEDAPEEAIQKADVETERQIFAAGAGLLIGRVLTLDASYEYQVGKRSIPTLVDDRPSQRVVLSGSYRF